MKKLIFLFLLSTVFTSTANSQSADSFITIWNLTNAGAAGNNSISFFTLNLQPVSYSWETIPAGQSGSGTFPATFILPDLRTINGLPANATIRLSIAPLNLRYFGIDNNVNSQRLTQVTQWGTTSWLFLSQAFRGCSNLNINSTDVPDLSSCLAAVSMFEGCSSLTGPFNINTWSTGTLVNVENMFKGATAFNQPLSNWNTANVTNMKGMFENATAFNQPIGNWNVAKITDMSNMFKGASSFNRPLNWNTALVTNMSSMFENATVFNQNLGSWQLNQLSTAQNMFNGSGLKCKQYTQTLIGWAANTSIASNVVFGASSKQYGLEAVASRNTLSTTKNWTITDGGSSGSNCIVNTPIIVSATGGVSSATYTTLQNAFAAINNGIHQQNITISVNENTTETASAVLNASGTGSTNYSSININATGIVTVSGNINGPLVDFNGADNITISGNTGGGDLTFSNTSTNATASTIRFVNDATSINITGTNILGSTGWAATTGLGVVYFAEGTTTGNDNINITNCNIGAAGTNFPINGIYSSGLSANVENNNNTISSNRIFDFFNPNAQSNGIKLIANTSNWTISGNILYQTSNRTFTNGAFHTGIDINSGSGYTIANNTIGGNSPSFTGIYTMLGNVATNFIAISLTSGNTTTPVNTINNNTISKILLETSSTGSTSSIAGGVFFGINVINGNNNIIRNQIGSAAGVDIVNVRPSLSGAYLIGIHNGSTGSMVINENQFGALTCSSTSATVTVGTTAIVNTASSASLEIKLNIIGHTSDANSIRAGTLGLTTVNSFVAGIQFTAATNCTIEGNSILNMASYGTGTAGYVRGIFTNAATGNSSIFNIRNNTIWNLTSNTTNTAIGNGVSGVSGISLSVGTNSVITQNTIYNLSNTNTGTNLSYVVGIGQANATNTTISRNTIYGLQNAGTSTTANAPSVVAGIVIRSGNTAVGVQNNMISLGRGQNTNTVIVGIMCNNGSTPNPVMNILHNTVHIEGTVAAGAQPSFGIARTDFTNVAKTATVNILNNIVNNVRSGGAGQHFAIGNNYGATASNTGWSSNASNFNVLNANVNTIGFWTTAQNFAGWKTSSLSDNNSFTGISVPFVDPAIANLRLNLGTTPTQIESAGTTTAVLVDIDNQNRPGPSGSVNGGANAPDIGADEFDGVILDLNPPVISYTPFNFACNGTARTLIVSISDASGIPISGTGLPVLYWKVNAGTWTPVTATYLSGNNYSFSFGGGINVGDNVSYYIVAQDKATTPNITAFPSAGASGFTSNPPAVSVPPTNPSSYQFSTALSGLYTVGVGGNYATLTAAVNDYNTKCLNGAITFSLIDATYPNETYPIVIRNNENSSIVNTLTIKPATGVNANLTGSSTTALLVLEGADYITIDGTNGNTINDICPPSSATRNLTIQNTNPSTSSAVISLQNINSDGASFNNIYNCNIIGNSNTTTSVAVNISGPNIGNGANAFNNNNNSIINNRITKAQIGVFVGGQSITNKNSNGRIEQNLMDGAVATQDNIGRVGIMVLFADSYTIKGNSIKNLESVTGSNDLMAIALGTNSMSNNLSSGGETTNTVVSNNFIDNIKATNTFSAGGIVVSQTSSGTNTIANNMISNIYANGTANDFGSGILVAGGSGITNVYHNSVTMNTTGALTGGAFPNVALSILGSNPVVNVLNNILVANGPGNGATINNVALGLGYALPASNLNSNNNALFAIGSGSHTAITNSISNTGLTFSTIANWQTASSKDLNSISVLPNFVAGNGLFLDVNTNSGLNNAGIPIAIVTTDIACENRSSTNPDIGADEFGIVSYAFRSNGNVTLDATTNWEASSNGGATWVISPIIPNGNISTLSVLIRTGHRLDVSGVKSLRKLTLENGANMNMLTAAVLTVNN